MNAVREDADVDSVVRRDGAVGSVADSEIERLPWSTRGPGGEPWRVLVVDDDPGAADVVGRALDMEGFAHRTAYTLAEARRMRAELAPHLVLLDLRLPDGNGLELLREIRAGSNEAVIVVSGAAAPDDRIIGLDIGADDYIGKPYRTRELLARVRSVLRGRQSPGALVLEYGPLTIDTTAKSVHLDGEPVDLPAREFALLAAFAQHPGRVLSKETLLRDVWGSNESWQTPKTVTEHVRRLRSRLDPHPEERSWIATRRGEGYRFDP